MDLALAVASDLHRACRAQAIAHARHGLWPESYADVDHGDAGRGYRRARGEHEMGVAIAIGIDSLHVDDPARCDAAAADISRAAHRPELRLRHGRGGGRGPRVLRA